MGPRARPVPPGNGAPATSACGERTDDEIEVEPAPGLSAGRAPGFRAAELGPSALGGAITAGRFVLGAGGGALTAGEFDFETGGGTLTAGFGARGRAGALTTGAGTLAADGVGIKGRGVFGPGTVTSGGIGVRGTVFVVVAGFDSGFFAGALTAGAGVLTAGGFDSGFFGFDSGFFAGTLTAGGKGVGGFLTYH